MKFLTFSKAYGYNHSWMNSYNLSLLSFHAHNFTTTNNSNNKKEKTYYFELDILGIAISTTFSVKL